MTPLSQAVKTVFAYSRHDNTKVYKGTCSAVWSITVPHGGYVLSTILNSLLQHQSTTTHKDPAHITCQYLSASSIAPLEIHIKTFSTSKRWTRLDVALLQQESNGSTAIRIRAHALFTNLPTLDEQLQPPSAKNVTIMPASPSEYARICPLAIHPALSKETEMHPDFKFRDRIKWAEGVEEKLPNAARKRMEWGAWFELKDEGEDVRESAVMMPFFSDMFKNGPETLPEGSAPGPSWFPTLTLSLDFKTKFPLPQSSSIAPRTVGLYAVTDFVHDGRHDERVEVWSAPCAIGADVVVGSDAWRKECRILAVSTQMALVLPEPSRTAVPKSKL